MKPEEMARRQAIARIERSDADFSLSVPLPAEPEDPMQKRAEVIEASRRKYGTLRSEIPTHRPADPAPEDSPTPEPERPPDPSPSTPAQNASEPPPRPQEGAPRKEPPRPGKGGGQHKAIQHRLKCVGESLGFRTILEKQISSTLETIDLYFSRPPIVIACEISLSTTVDHEVGNIAKCLRADFDHVALVCPMESKLKKIQAAAAASLGAEALAKVQFFTPDSFIAYLQSLVIPPDTQTKRRGYTVERKFVSLSPEQTKARQDIAANALISAAKKRRKRSI